MKANLTDVSVRALKPPPKGQLTIWDKTSPLGVRVSQGGSKTFILMSEAESAAPLGRFGIADSRKRARKHAGSLQKRPLGLPAPDVKQGMLFDIAVTAFIEEHYRLGKARTKMKQSACSQRTSRLLNTEISLGNLRRRCKRST